MTDEKGDLQGVCIVCGEAVYHDQKEASAVNVESITYRTWFGQKTTMEGAMWICLKCLEKMNNNLEKNAGGPMNDN